MRRLAWLGLTALALLIWASVADPGMRFRPAPEVSPRNTSFSGSVDSRLREVERLGEELDDVRLTRVDWGEAGIIEVDAHFTGDDPPQDQTGWNSRAKQIANHLAQSPANTQTVRVNLYHRESLRAQAVTSRAE